MAKDYTKAANTALKLIKKFGLSGLFIRNEGLTSDNTKPWGGKELTDIGYPAYIALVPMSSSDRSMLTDSIAVKSLSLAFMDAVGFTEIPEVGDSISVDGVIWQIETIEPLKPATVNIVWQMVVSQ